MKKILLALLAVPLIAFGQTYPSPTFSSLTLQNPLTAANGGLGVNNGSANGIPVFSSGTATVTSTPNLGTPSSITLTNGTGLPISTGISGLGTGVAAGLANSVTGSGSPVLATSPTIANPTITGTLSGPSLSSSSPNAVIFGSNQGHFGNWPWNTAPVAIGSTLNRSTPGSGETVPNEFLLDLQSTQTSIPLISGMTNAATATSSNVLHFSMTPVGIVVGMNVTDLTNLTAISSSMTVTAVGSNTVTLSSNVLSPGVSSGDTINFGYSYFKGPLFVSSFGQDSSAGTINRSHNGATFYSVIPNGYSNVQAEGVVIVAMDQGGTGNLMNEFDIGPTNNSNSNHCDSVTTGLPLCHTNLWVSNIGTVNGSWVLDTGFGGAGWNNGIGLRYVSSGGIALFIPNNTSIVSQNHAGTGQIILMEDDTTDTVQVGVGASSIVMNATTNVSGNITATGSGALPVYGVAGGSLAAPHAVQGQATLSSGSATVTLSGSAVFSAAAYSCTANDLTAANPVRVSLSSGSSFTLVGTGSDVIDFICIGR